MSTLSVDTIQGQTAATKVKLPAGCVLQTINAQNTTLQSTTNTDRDISPNEMVRKWLNPNGSKPQ